MNASALVTGAAGFMGSHLVDHLLGMGMDVTGLDDLSGGFREARIGVVLRATGRTRKRRPGSRPLWPCTGKGKGRQTPFGGRVQ